VKSLIEDRFQEFFPKKHKLKIYRVYSSIKKVQNIFFNQKTIEKELILTPGVTNKKYVFL